MQALNLVIFPNCLFRDKKTLQEFTNVFVVEEPIFFTGSTGNYNINKVKLAYMRACMKCYCGWLRKTFPKKVITYVDYDDVHNSGYDFLRHVQKGNSYSYFDPVDYDVEEKLLKMNLSINKIDTQLFLISTEDIKEYFNSKKELKRIGQAPFYEWMKKRLGLVGAASAGASGILQGVGNLDKENRVAFPKRESQSQNWEKPTYNRQRSLKPYYDEAIKYIDTHTRFKNNIGSCENVSLYPIDEVSAKRHFDRFLKHSLADFGRYEDAILKEKDADVMYHSCVSCALNNGLLSPQWVLDTLVKYAEQKEHKESKNKIPMNSLEGYIRQIIGWREFMRGIYVTFHTDFKNKNNNYFGASKHLVWSKWYGQGQGTGTGTGTGITLLDDEISKAVNTGYAHHIIRLMVFLNMFVLLEVCLEDVVRWFMEVVAIDAYPWVMYSNIAAMGYYDKRFMTRPYISSSAYLLKMSNYPKGQWCEQWTALYHAFVKKHASLLKGSGAGIYVRANAQSASPSPKAKIDLDIVT